MQRFAKRFCILIVLLFRDNIFIYSEILPNKSGKFRVLKHYPDTSRRSHPANAILIENTQTIRFHVVKANAHMWRTING
jgi:hypothetical protein